MAASQESHSGYAGVRVKPIDNIATTLDYFLTCILEGERRETEAFD